MLDSKVEEQLQAEIKAELAKLEGTKEVEKKEEVSPEETTAPSSTENTESSTNEDQYLAEAVKMGYDPNYKGPNKKTPEQFVKDGSFFKKIDAQKKDIEELKQLFKASEERSRKIEEATRKRVLEELEAAKIKAVSEGDVEAYKQADQKHREEIQQISKAPVVDEIPGEVKEFIERNKDWFNINTPENELMAKTADGLSSVVKEEARLRGESLSLNEELKRVEERIKILFPARFENSNQSKPAMTAKSTVSTGDKPKTLASRLSKKQREYFEAAKEYGSKLSVEEYAKQLQLTGDLRDE
jgi:hypothetical protein